MPGKFWPKRMRPGYMGQVMSAGALIVVASLLMFAVVNTLEIAKPPVVKTVPNLENKSAVEHTAVNQNPMDNQNLQSEQEQAKVPEAPFEPAQTVAAASNKNVSNQLIAELWNGTKMQGFGWQLHPVYRDWRYHNGVDISGSEGQIVPALASGEIIDIYTDKQYGLTVAVDSGKYTMYYSSLASVVVQKNATIKAGAPVGSMGISASELEPHLHFAVKPTGGQEYIDPGELFPNIPN